ncbi:hypothetical protein AB1286_29985 [Trinickia sp. NRRL B-1857]|uniref:hypothetical protein n=1 Tax=Trinickia sp. NRRL B-1857 TaxID=3162879 RepID=UPI003D29790A
MKLCKDCKHVAMPNPLANANAGYPPYVMMMCGHPSAPSSPVDGRALATCSQARGEGQFLREAVEVLDCGPDAKLFEQREAEAPGIGQMVPVLVNEQFGAEAAKPWWRRVFGG